MLDIPLSWNDAKKALCVGLVSCSLASCLSGHSDANKQKNLTKKDNLIEVSAIPGKGIDAILQSHHLSLTKENRKKFLSLNNMESDDVISLDRTYYVWSDDVSSVTIHKPHSDQEHTLTSMKDYFRQAEKRYQKYHTALDLPLVDYRGIVSLATKESNGRFDAVSNTGARGYGGLKSSAIADVKKYLHDHGVSDAFDPLHNEVDHCFFVYVYFGMIQQQLSRAGVSASDKDMFLFSLLSYNGGYNKFLALYKAAGSPATCDELVLYIVKKLMHLSGVPVMKNDATYNVPYGDYFTQKFSDTNVIFRGRYGSYPIRLTAGKAKEMIRYVEIISALMQKD